MVSVRSVVRTRIGLRALFCRSLLLILSAWVVCNVAIAPSYGQGVNREYKLKAVYLYKFATYIEWPENSFQDANSPFVIGILGPNPVGVDLQKIAKVKKIGSRKIEIHHYKTVDEVRNCHILFMTRAVKGETQRAVLQQLAGQHVLFVGETSDFLASNGVIGFVVFRNRVTIQISKSAYQREGLTIRAALLRIAKVVD